METYQLKLRKDSGDQGWPRALPWTCLPKWWKSRTPSPQPAWYDDEDSSAQLPFSWQDLKKLEGPGGGTTLHFCGWVDAGFLNPADKTCAEKMPKYVGGGDLRFRKISLKNSFVFGSFPIMGRGYWNCITYLPKHAIEVGRTSRESLGG